MNLWYSVILKPLAYFALWMDPLSMHHFEASWIGHLENTGLLDYTDLPKYWNTLSIISKKEKHSCSLKALSEKSSELGSCGGQVANTSFPRFQVSLEKLISSLSTNTISCFPEKMGSLHSRKCPLNTQVWITLVCLVLSSTNGVPWRRGWFSGQHRHIGASWRFPMQSGFACVLTASDC